MKKQKLIALFLSLGIALSTATGCTAVNNHKKLNDKRNNIAETMSADAGVNFFKVNYMSLNKNEDGHFVKFKGHYDTKFTPGWYGGTYENHKDYYVTYKIDKDIYNKLYKINKGSSTLLSLPEADLDNIQSVIDTYDVYAVEEIEDENHLCK